MIDGYVTNNWEHCADICINRYLHDDSFERRICLSTVHNYYNVGVNQTALIPSHSIWSFSIRRIRKLFHFSMISIHFLNVFCILFRYRSTLISTGKQKIRDHRRSSGRSKKCFMNEEMNQLHFVSNQGQ